jgi:hypothetical protein
MNYTRDDREVFKAFMEQRELESRFLKTDGQSLFSSSTRIAEHYPHDDGSASTLVYDFTDRGQAFIDKHIQWHVIQVKRMVPRQNVVPVPLAQKVGLVELSATRRRDGNSFSKA